MPGFELIGKEEKNAVDEVFDKSGILFRHGFDNLRNGIYKVKEFEEKFAERMKIPYVLAVTSGSAALRVALAALNIGPGDEVITQSFTFVATVEAIIESGAIPIITEVDNTLNMDPGDLEKKITKKTKAIIVVHMLGVPARMDLIKEIASKYNLYLIEDSAWGCGGYWNNYPLGTIGDIGTFSFDFAKTITTGEGGMLVFKDEDIYKAAAAWHDHGHENNPNLPRWEDSRSSSGFNFRMMELQGAVGLVQLERLSDVVNAQRKNYFAIEKRVKKLKNIEIREVPENSLITADALVFFVPNSDFAKKARDILVNNGIGTKILPEAISWHFAGMWDHMDTLVKANNNLRFLKSEELLSRSVAIPIFVNMEKNIGEKIYTVLQPLLG